MPKKIKNEAIYLTSDIYEWTVEEIRQLIINSSENKIDLYISSYGGYVDEAFELANFIEGVNNKDIHTHILSHADSAATIVFLSAKLENRHAVSSSTFMIHSPKTFLFDQLDEEDAENLQHQLAFAKNRILDYYEKRLTGLSRNDITDMMENETYMTAEELEQYGAIKEVLESFDIAAYNKKFTKNSNKMLKIRNKKVEPINSITLDDGKQLIYEGELSKGTELRNFGDPETLSGEFTLKDGRKVTIDKDNKVTNIVDAPGADDNKDDDKDDKDDNSQDNKDDDNKDDDNKDDDNKDDDNKDDDNKDDDDENKVEDLIDEKIEGLKTELTGVIKTEMTNLKKSIGSSHRPAKNGKIQNNKGTSQDIHDFVDESTSKIQEDRKKESGKVT